MKNHQFDNVKILSNVKAEVTIGNHFEPHGTLQHVAHFPHPGVVCQLRLGAAGLMYQRGKEVAVVPHDELVKMFETAHPQFAEAPDRPAEGALPD
jgi:hypothetical protein